MAKTYFQKPYYQNNHFNIMIPKKQIAKERIEILFEQAKESFKSSPSLSNRYVTMARKISMKYKVPIPQK